MNQHMSKLIPTKQLTPFHFSTSHNNKRRSVVWFIKPLLFL